MHEPDKLNPYLAPQQGHLPARAAVASDDSPPAGSIRFWEGRKALLKSLFYMRCWAVVTTLLGLRAGYQLIAPYVSCGSAASVDGAPSLADPWLAAMFLIMALALLVGFTLAYVTWRYAQALQRIAGRHDSDPTDLCHLHLLCWRFKTAALVVVVLEQGVFYLYERTVVSSFEAIVGQ